MHIFSCEPTAEKFGVRWELGRGLGVAASVFWKREKAGVEKCLSNLKYACEKMRMPLNDKKIQPNDRNISQNEENVHTKCKCCQIYFERGIDLLFIYTNHIFKCNLVIMMSLKIIHSLISISILLLINTQFTTYYNFFCHMVSIFCFF